MKFRLITLAMFLATAFTVRAETVYVIDKLLVGVHAEKSVDSKIIKAFPTGTALEIQQRDGDMAKIKGPDGISGWVDAVYLSKDPPAAMVVDNLESQNRKLVEDLKQAQEKLAAANAQLEARQPDNAAGTKATTSDPAELAKLQQEIETLQHSLDAERGRSGELQSKLSELKNTSPADAQALADLTQENAALKEDLEQAQIQAIQNVESSPAPGDPANSKGSGVLNLPISVLVFIALALLVASFLAGIWLMDARQRRRLGGFRI